MSEREISGVERPVCACPAGLPQHKGRCSCHLERCPLWAPIGEGDIFAKAREVMR